MTEAQIIADARKRFPLNAADIALEAQQEVQRPGHGDVISEGGARREEDRRQQQERQERFLLLA